MKETEAVRLKEKEQALITELKPKKSKINQFKSTNVTTD